MRLAILLFSLRFFLQSTGGGNGIVFFEPTEAERLVWSAAREFRSRGMI